MAEGRFQGKVVLITGAGSGFGAEAARRFAAKGANLILSDINADNLADVSSELTNRGANVHSDCVDVSNETVVANHVTAGIKTFGALDVAVNNAGVGHDLIPITDISSEMFDRMMAVNARGVFLGMKYQLPLMVEKGSGAILNVASAAGLVGAGYLSAYAASKHAVVGLTRAAADEVARKGVRVNALCPSFASTPLFDEMADSFADQQGMSRDDAHKRISGRVPMRRVAEVDEVVQAILWACDPANSFMTGQAISIDGGLTAV